MVKDKSIFRIRITIILAALILVFVFSAALLFFTPQSVVGSGVDLEKIGYVASPGSEPFLFGTPIISSGLVFVCDNDGNRYTPPAPKPSCWEATIIQPDTNNDDIVISLGETKKLNDYVSIRMESADGVVKPDNNYNTGNDYSIAYSLIVTDPSFLTVVPDDDVFLVERSSTLGTIFVTYKKTYPHDLNGGFNLKTTVESLGLETTGQLKLGFTEDQQLVTILFDDSVLGVTRIEVSPFVTVGPSSNPVNVNFLQKETYKANVVTNLDEFKQEKNISLDNSTGKSVDEPSVPKLWVFLVSGLMLFTAVGVVLWQRRKRT